LQSEKPVQKAEQMQLTLLFVGINIKIEWDNFINVIKINFKSL